MSDVLRHAARRAVAILLGSLYAPKRAQSRAAGDERHVLKAGLRGEEYPETDTERDGLAREDVDVRPE